jgi:hypothetical protein
MAEPDLARAAACVPKQDMDALGQKPLGPALIARAWADSEFKARLLRDAKAAAAEMGFKTGDVETAEPAAASAQLPPVPPV